MCGITVFKDVRTDELSGLLKESWTLLNHRGNDSFGLILVNDNNEVKTIKSLNDKELIKTLKSKYKNDEFKLAIAHNRKASIGKINMQLAHPIRVGNVIVIHNGTNSKLLNIVTDAKSDTQAIATILNNRENPFIKKHINNWLIGSGVIIAYDIEKKKWLFWKDKTRPFVKSVSNGYYSSEPIEFNESYRIINNTNRLVERKKFDYVFTRGKRFDINDILYPGYCSICGRVMLIESSVINAWDLFNVDDICWECKVLNKHMEYRNYYR